jgi:hypothetical protein
LNFFHPIYGIAFALIFNKKEKEQHWLRCCKEIKGDYVMKKLSFILFTFLLGLMIPTISQALSLTDAGGYDLLVAETSLPNSGSDTQLNWVNDVLDGEFILTTATVLGSWIDISDANATFAYAISGMDTDYFLIKTGNVTKDANRDFLFQNIGDLSWAVINLNEMGFKKIENINGVSHIDTYGNAPVPEPATMLLLGSGLVGLAGFGRKKFKK